MITHGQAVASKAQQVALRLPDLNPDLKFIFEAAMLHDIGIFKTNAPGIGCSGSEPYIRHGILGRELLEKEGWPQHALVCERHIGTGLAKAVIDRDKLPLPSRDMRPQTLEEKIVCFADKFYSKNKDHLRAEKSIERIIRGLEKHGRQNAEQFHIWLKEFREIE